MSDLQSGATREARASRARPGRIGKGLATCVLACVVTGPWAIGAAHAQAVNACGSLQRGDGGPFDYRTEKGMLKTVETFHFTPEVESLVRGKSGPIAADLDFVLRAFPNHHRALMAMALYGEKVKSPQPIGANYPIECYFDRAIRFRADDTIVRMIYATYLSKGGRAPDAVQQLQQASKQAGDNAFTHYNIGMVYFELKRFDESLAAAHTAYGLGFSRPELRDRLKTAGKWKDAPERAAAAASAASEPAAESAAPGAAKPASQAASQAD
jgi:hypothetical protein